MLGGPGRAPWEPSHLGGRGSSRDSPLSTLPSHLRGQDWQPASGLSREDPPSLPLGDGCPIAEPRGLPLPKHMVEMVWGQARHGVRLGMGSCLVAEAGPSLPALRPSTHTPHSGADSPQVHKSAWGAVLASDLTFEGLLVDGRVSQAVTGLTSCGEAANHSKPAKRAEIKQEERPGLAQLHWGAVWAPRCLPGGRPTTATLRVGRDAPRHT